MELLKRINEKAKCVVQMTLTTHDEELCKILEPNVCTTKERVKALNILRENGIPTVVWLSPILPFINDTKENIEGILNDCIQAKVYGIICFGMGVTLREGDREYFYAALDKHFPGMKERTIVINGFSKTYAMTGWRMGYAAGPKEIISPMTKLHQYGIMSAPTMSQYAAIEALKNGDDDIAEMRDQYDMRRRLIVDGLNRLGLTCFEPEGAFYVFPSIQSTGMTSDEFCERLIYDKHVAVVPGSAFGACGEGFVRISYAYSIKHLAEALNRIGAFLKELK